MTKQLGLAMTAAAEYRQLVALGRYPEADQVARSIDELVGRWSMRGGRRVWAWPAAVRRAAGR